MKAKFEKLNELIRKNNSFVLVSHVNTDGDALGSLITCYHFLRNLGKEVLVVVPGEIPEKYTFLETEKIFSNLPGAEINKFIKETDVIIILDISALDRLDEYYDSVMNSGAIRICIDHHPLRLNGDQVALSIVCQEKIATAEIIYDFLNSVNAPIKPPMARALYAAILSDSGGFRFQGTSSSTLAMAAELVGLGADPVAIYSGIYESASHNQLKAWGDILSQLKKEGDLSWVEIDLAFLKTRKISLMEIDGLVDLMRKDAATNVAAVFVEKEPGVIIVGLRSKNGLNVGRIARQFEGGGHFHAAGFTSEGDMKSVVSRTIKSIRSAGEERE